MNGIADIKHQNNITSSIPNNIPIEIVGALFIEPFLLTDGTLPKTIPIKDLQIIFPGTLLKVQHTLTYQTGWYEIDGPELVITLEGESAQMLIGEILWIVKSFGGSSYKNRDMRGVILASKLIGNVSTYGAYLAEIQRILSNAGIDLLVEFGQGSGDCICSTLALYPNISGIAIDLDPAAAALTKATAVKYHVTDRIKIFTGDINDGFPEVMLSRNVLIIGGFVIHDFMDIQKGVKVLSDSLPVYGKIVLAELVKDTSDELFAGAILCFHDKLGIRIPTMHEWEDFFYNASLKLTNVITDGVMPGACIFTLEKEPPSPKFINANRKKFPCHSEEVLTIDLVDFIPPYHEPSELAFVDMSDFPKGISGTHTHEFDETYTITSGIVQVVINGESFQVEGPSGVYIPAGVKHYWKPIKVKKGDFIFGIFTKGGKL